MEAAGIEPASRDVSIKASTCVVGDLDFTQTAEHRHPEVFAISKLYLATSVSKRDSLRSGIGDQHSRLSSETYQLGLSISRQPMRKSYLLQLKVLVRFLRSPLTSYDTPF